MNVSYIECIYCEIYKFLDIIDLKNLINCNFQFKKKFLEFTNNKCLYLYSKELLSKKKFNLLLDGSLIKNYLININKNYISFEGNLDLTSNTNKFIKWNLINNNINLEGKIFIDPHYIEDNNKLAEKKFYFNTFINYFCDDNDIIKINKFKLVINKPVFLLAKLPIWYNIDIGDIVLYFSYFIFFLINTYLILIIIS